MTEVSSTDPERTARLYFFDDRLVEVPLSGLDLLPEPWWNSWLVRNTGTVIAKEWNEESARLQRKNVAEAAARTGGVDGLRHAIPSCRVVAYQFVSTARVEKPRLCLHRLVLDERVPPAVRHYRFCQSDCRASEVVAPSPSSCDRFFDARD